MQFEMIFTDAQPGSDALAEFCTRLQPLPSHLRYYDEFNDTTRSIQSPAESNSFEIHFLGRVLHIDFGSRQEHCGIVLKHVFAMMLEQNLSTSTIAKYFGELPQPRDDYIKLLLQAGPLEIGALWAEWRAREWSVAAYTLAKNVLYLLCIYRWNGWSSEYRTFLSTTLPLSNSRA